MIALQDRLGYTFKNPELLTAALTHRSYCAEQHAPTADNQRLEYLGDAVIQIIVTAYLFRTYPTMSEGQLTKLRAAVTREATLAQLARQLDIGSALRLGHGEELHDGRDRTSNLCDACEALFGAIFLDSDGQLGPATLVFECLANDTLAALAHTTLQDNPKGALQEYAQKHLQLKPEYRLVSISGPDHARTFVVAVHLGQEPYGQGSAGKRQTAEEEAARAALARIFDPPADPVVEPMVAAAVEPEPAPAVAPADAPPPPVAPAAP